MSRRNFQGRFFPHLVDENIKMYVFWLVTYYNGTQREMR